MNESAFPTTIHNYGDGMYASEGMTLRDYFAAKTLQGILSSGNLQTVNFEKIAKDSYAMADAMLKAREQ